MDKRQRTSSMETILDSSWALSLVLRFCTKVDIVAVGMVDKTRHASRQITRRTTFTFCPIPSSTRALDLVIFGGSKDYTNNLRRAAQLPYLTHLTIILREHAPSNLWEQLARTTPPSSVPHLKSIVVKSRAQGDPYETSATSLFDWLEAYPTVTQLSLDNISLADLDQPAPSTYLRLLSVVDCVNRLKNPITLPTLCPFIGDRVSEIIFELDDGPMMLDDVHALTIEHPNIKVVSLGSSELLFGEVVEFDTQKSQIAYIQADMIEVELYMELVELNPNIEFAMSLATRHLDTIRSFTFP
jgi:hypothetical protein